MLRKNAFYLILIIVALSTGMPAVAIGVSGKVVDSSDNPVEGATVIETAYLSSLTNQVTTDADGKFQIEVEAIGALVVRGKNGDLGFWSLFNQGPIVLNPPRKLEVTVLNSEELPAANASVHAYGDDNSSMVLGTGKTDSQGHLTLEIPTGTTLKFILAEGKKEGLDYVLFIDADRKNLTEHRLPQDHDEPIILTLQPTVAASVIVHDEYGNPLPGVSVNPWLYGLANHGGQANLGLLFRQNTDDLGYAFFPRVPLNHCSEPPTWNEDSTPRLCDVTFFVSKQGYQQNKMVYFDPRSDENEITTIIRPKIRVPIIVTNAEGTPIPEASILIDDNPGVVTATWQKRITDPRGTYTEAFVFGRPYVISARNSTGDEVTNIVSLAIEDPETEPIKLTFQPQRRIFGKVTDSEGSPVEGFDFYIARQAPKGSIINDLLNSIKEKVITDSEGNYTFYTADGFHHLLNTGGAKRKDGPYGEFEVKEEDYEINLEVPTQK